MASLFPQAIDSFANPVYTKIDGEDVVKASHVNDLQDALRATQETLVGAGITINYASNRYIADNTSFKNVVETLDAQLGVQGDNLVNHSAFSLPTDPAQHHANVIEVTPVGNLSSNRVQTALVEHQADIDNIMTGNIVNGVTLDNRYLTLTGAQTLSGPISITGDLTVDGNTIFGTDATDTTIVNAEIQAKSTIEVDGNLTTNQDIYLQAGQKIAEEGATNASYLLFDTEKIELYSHKDIIFRIDADDAIDGLSQDGRFSIYNGLNSEIFSVNESGDVNLTGSLNADTLEARTSLLIGSSSELEVYTDGSEYDSDSYHLQLDKNDLSGTARFVVTMNGDTGASLASPDLLLNIDEAATLTTGLHILREGVQETGFLGMQTYSNNAGGVFYGQGVNFKHVMANAPSSITLSITDNLNAQNISVTEINQYGFFWTFDSVAVGSVRVRGTYITIGN